MILTLSPFATKLFNALNQLAKDYEPHPCGGFTTDDMQWRMGVAFTPDETLWEAIDELTDAHLIEKRSDASDAFAAAPGSGVRPESHENLNESGSK